MIVPPRNHPGGAPRWLRRSAFWLVLVSLVASIPVLAWVGWRYALDAEGRVSERTAADPSAPGYRAVVSPTNTMLVVHRTPQGQLGSIFLLASSGGGGGGAVLLVPTSLLADHTASRPRTLRAIYADEGVPGVEHALNRLFRIGFQSTVTADPRDWEAAVAAKAPLRFDNPDELSGPDGEVAFPAGPLELQADQLEPYLRFSLPDEDERAQLYRAQLVWESWAAGGGATTTNPDRALAADRAADPTASLAAMVADLSRDRVEVLALPVEVAGEELLARLDDASRFGSSSTRAGSVGIPGAPTSPVFVVEESAARALVSSLVPFPTSAQPGDRIRVRLLDGMGDAARAINLAGVLVPAGAEITIFGNADRFDYPATLVEYFEEAQAANAQAMAAALGVTSATFNPAGDTSVDVSVTVGRDVTAGNVSAKLTMPSVVPVGGG